MKNVTKDKGQHRFISNENVNKLDQLLTLSNINHLHNQEEVTPPSHVWDRIEQALNQQAIRHAEVDQLINASFQAVLQPRS